MVNKAGTARECPCLRLWLSVVPQCLWQHRDIGMKGMEERGEKRYSISQRVGVGPEEVGGWIHAAVWPWRQTGSPEIRGVINLSVEPANPTSPCPGNLAGAGGGRAEMSKEREEGDRERNEGKEYALWRVVCPFTSFAAGQVMKHNSGKTYDYCHCFLPQLPLSPHSRNLIFGEVN